jgi:hypothetical protein
MRAKAFSSSRDAGVDLAFDKESRETTLTGREELL